MNPIYKPFLTEEMIANRIKELGAKISQDYKEKELLVISVLKGAFIFTADLIRQIKTPLDIDFIQLASYEGMHSTGQINIKADISSQVEGRHVLIVEDIVDSGRTILFLKEHLRSKRPSSVRVCTLLSKPSEHTLSNDLHYVGFEVSKEFLIGYGLDLDGRFRELPYLAQVVGQS